MSWIRDTPIRRKLTAAFALVTGGALVLVAFALVVADLLHVRRDAEAQLLAEAALIGANIRSAIAFNDPEAAAETLATLHTISDVTDAILYDADGDRLAHYARDGKGTPGFDPHLDHHHLTEGHLVVTHDIRLDGRQIGTVVLRSDLRSRDDALVRDALVTLAVAVAAFALALLVALRLQRLVTVPLLDLADLAQRVSRDADYALRAPVGGDDEIGRLSRGVNEMLETVQRRDRELASHRSRLESLVAERTADLEKINERLTAELGERERTEGRLTRALAELERHHRESEILAEMNDRLQVCRDVAEVAPVIALYGARLFPGAAGSVHVFDEDRSSVEPLGAWGPDGGEATACLMDDCWALRRGQVHAVPAPGTELVCPHVGEVAPAGGYLCVPMLSQGNVTGFLHVRFDRRLETGRRPVDGATTLASSAAERVALAVASLQLRARLREQSVHDPLTGLHNRRYMEESLAREIARAERARGPLAVAMLDLDHFKRYNDSYGHDAGDALLRALGALLQQAVRAEDVACRFGGEEFTLIMPSAGLDAACRRAEEIRELVSRLDVEHHGGRLGGITISIGVAIYPDHGATGEALIRAADAALYEAKASGRDRVVAYSADGPRRERGRGQGADAGQAA